MGKHPISLPICRRSGKRTYRTQQGALASVITRAELHVYKCPHCPGWHLTSQPRT